MMQLLHRFKFAEVKDRVTPYHQIYLPKHYKKHSINQGLGIIIDGEYLSDLRFANDEESGINTDNVG